MRSSAIFVSSWLAGLTAFFAAFLFPFGAPPFLPFRADDAAFFGVEMLPISEPGFTSISSPQCGHFTVTIAASTDKITYRLKKVNGKPQNDKKVQHFAGKVQKIF
jgi:hypothetical protein